jgi:hypothetical protein
VSTELRPTGEMGVTSFYGGQDRGACIQLTPLVSRRDGRYAQLTRDDVVALVETLQAWLRGELLEAP